MGKFAFVAFAVCLPCLLSAQVKVPFVGCASAGQVGPLEAPKGEPRVLSITETAASRLAYYKAEMGDLGVLAPRGWYCFGVYGSGGDALFIRPRPFDASSIFTEKWTGFSGPAIQLSHRYGGTSGRFDVVSAIARVFPAHRDFIDAVVEMDLALKNDFHFGPYPADKLTYKNNETVEYETPAQTQGLGTDSQLRKNSSPIRGVAILFGEDTDLLHLSLRLPANLDHLAPVIIHHLEHDSQKTQP